MDLGGAVRGMLALIVAAATSVAAAAGQEPYVSLSGHTLSPEVFANASALAFVPKSVRDEPLTLTIVLRRSDEAGFAQFLAEVQDPRAANYRRFATPKELAERFGPTQADYDAVAAHFIAQGFTIVEGSDNRMTLTVRGTRSAAEDALKTDIKDLVTGNRSFYANAGDPRLPASLASKVQSIVGLSNLALPVSFVTKERHKQIHEACLAAHIGILELTAIGAFLTGGVHIPLIVYIEIVVGLYCFSENLGYNLFGKGRHGGGGHDQALTRPGDPMLPSITHADGTGQTIGLVQFDTFMKSDISDYLAFARLPANLVDNVSEVHVNGGAPLGAGANEVLLDLIVVMSLASGARFVVYDAPLGTSFQTVFNAAINGGSTVITNSWAYCENQTTLSDVQSIESLFQSAAASGISIFNASGDSGSTCLNGSPNVVAVPASAPTATAVGGSSMTLGPGLTYGSETWWDGSAATPPTGQGGFGVSQYFSRPSYQNGFTASAFRSIPDVVANADPAKGIVICQAADGGCPSGKFYGGTSMTAPAWAAYTARLNQALGANLGAANPAFYSVANTTGFHNASAMGSDFAHVGLGSPNLIELFLKLSGKATGLPNANESSMFDFVSGDDLPKLVGNGYPADGTTEVFVRVMLTDANLNTVAGKTVSLTANAGSSAVITPVNAVTSIDNGTAVFKVTNLAFESVTLTATDTTDGIVLATPLTIAFVPPIATSANIIASPNIVQNDGVATTTITVTLQDALGRPSPGKRVLLSQGNGRSIINGPNPSVTNASGQIQFTATNTIAEAVTYTAVDVTDGNLPVPGSATVTFGGQASVSCVTTPLPTAAAGFTLTPFSAGYLTGNLFFGNVNWGCRGASNPAFTTDGSVYVNNFIDGAVFKLPPQGGAAGSGYKVATTGPSLFGPVVGKDGRLYAARGATTGDAFTGAVYELDPATGAITRTVLGNLTCPTGLAADPLSGDLFFSDSCTGAGFDNPSLWRIANPASATPSLSIYATLPTTPTGWFGFAPDGTIFMPQSIAGGPGAPVLRISGTNQPFPPTMTPVPDLNTIYWVTVAEALPSGAAKSLIVLQGSTFKLADITTNPPVFTDLILNGTGSGMVGPDGCLYVSGLDTVYKLTPTSGICGFAVTNPAPALRLTPLSATLSQGTSLTLTAQFANVTVPAGTPVQFMIGDTNRQFLVGNTDANGKATVVVTGDFAGRDSAGAIATLGTTTYRSNMTSLTWSAGQHTTSLTLNATQDNGAAGQPLMLRAALVDTSLRPAVPISGANIQFTLGALGCNATTNASGIASCNVTPTTPANLILTATYAGNATYFPSTASQNVQIVGPPSTTLATSLSPVAVGTSFALTATVNAVAPTGTVSFRHELGPLPNCTAVPLTGTGNVKTAQCTVNSLGVGSYALTADYSGDGSNFPSSATIIQVISAFAGPHCGGFTDIAPTSDFCPSVEWLKNRLITLGCTSATLYCPIDNVIRMQMAAFMNRLGTALTDLVLWVQAPLGAIDLDVSNVVCQTSEFAVVNSPRRAIVDAIVSGQGGANASFVAETVASFDGGVTWAPLAGTAVAGSVTGGHWGNVRAAGVRDLDVGQNVRFGVQVSRGGLPGAGGLTVGRCNLRTQIGNRGSGYSPLDR